MIYKCENCNKVEEISNDSDRLIISEVGKVNNLIVKELNVCCEACGVTMIRVLKTLDYVIERANGHLKNKTWTKEHSKGYCFGYLDAVVEDDDLYDEYSVLIDDLFN